MQDPIVVVGGGVAGLGAAARLTRQGVPVILVEAQDRLGGHGGRWACMATTRCQGCGVCLVHDALAEVERSPLVETRVSRRVVGAQTHGDGFLVHLEAVGRPEKEQQRRPGQGPGLGQGREGGRGPGSAQGQGREQGQGRGQEPGHGRDTSEGRGVESIRAAGVVMAAGFSPYSPGEGRPLGAADHPGVITTVALNDALRAHRLEELPFSGGDSRSLAFLHCVGSRDPAAGRGYCSQVCCGTAFRMATRLRHLRPGWQITLFYIDLQIHGKEARLAWAEDQGIRLVQGVPAEIRPVRRVEDENGDASGIEASSDHRGAEQSARAAVPPLELVFQAPDGNLAMETFDGALLVVGMEPPPGLSALAGALGLPMGESGFVNTPSGQDPRIVASGACLGPRSIESSLVGGWAAAARIQGALPATRRSLFPVPAQARGPEMLAPLAAAGTCPASRTVAVLGRGDLPTRLADALENAGLGARRVRTAHADGVMGREAEPSVLVLEGTVGDFLLRLVSPDGPLEIRCGALVLCGDLSMPKWIRLPGAMGKPGEEIPAVDHLVPTHDVADAGEETETICLWLDPEGPAWRPMAAGLLAELADLAELRQTKGGGPGQLTLMARHVALPGLRAQANYDRARRAGTGVLRLGDSPPRLARQEAGWVLDVEDALLPEVPLRLRVDRLLGAGRPTPPGPVAKRVGVLPDAEGFAPRANVRLAPLRSERTGVYVIGASRGEALCEEEADQADALVEELALLLTSTPEPASHRPAEIDPRRCVQCLSCVRSCPHQAIPAPFRGAPVISPLGCQACGRCLAVCPALAITVQGSQALPAREALHGPREREELARASLMNASEVNASLGPDVRGPSEGSRPKEIVCFACSQGGAPALGQALAEGLLPGLQVRLHEVPCIGAVGELALLSALLEGPPRVLLLGCHPGSCAHLDGEALCALRVARLRRSLADMGVSPERLVHLAVSPAEAGRLAGALPDALTKGGQP